ncbi:MAG: HAMP domain-containing sensor histidine kinase [Myxococcota bacterium]
MRVDPNTKRARDVVWLVIFTVALPSLLLTALGAVAVKNEETAALARLKAIYKPTMRTVSNSFNETMDEMVEAAAVPLRELVLIADSEDPTAHSVDAFRERFDFTTSYYVMDEDGALLLPRTIAFEADSCMDASSVLPEALTSLLQERSHPSCSSFDPLLERGGSAEYSCAVKYAKASCLVSHGKLTVEEAVDSVCPPYQDHPATRKGLELREQHGRWEEARLGKAERVEWSESETVQTAQTRRELFDALSDPLTPAPVYFTELLSRDALTTVQDATALDYGRWRVAFYTLASRASLLRELMDDNHPWHAAAKVVSFRADGWRRVGVKRSIGGMVAGFEMIPPLIEPRLQEVLASAHAPGDLRAIVASVDLPDEVFPAEVWLKEPGVRVINWLLTKKSDLSWQLALALEEGSEFFSIERSRSTLYFWALILMSTALIFGLGYTVWAVIREARLSRLKTDFVSSVSHDLRTPLTSIRMFTEMLLLKRVRSEEEAHECLEVIAKETERLTRLTERILDFSRMEAGRKAYTYEPIDVAPVIEEAIESCRPLMVQGEFNVAVEIPPGLPRMCADRDAMIEVLMNLISNAIKYSTDEHFLAVRVRKEQEMLSVAVEDRGMGIPKVELKKIFEKFHRVDCRRTNEVSGSGIGLSLVEHIVEAHGGTIDVRSTPGRGSTFTVRVPFEGARKGEETDGAYSGYRGRPIDSPGPV